LKQPRARTAECYPGGLTQEAWAKIKIIDAVFKTQINQGADRDRVTCEALQQCFDVIARHAIKDLQKLKDQIWRQEIQDSILEIAVSLGWLDPRMRPTKIVWAHREWLSKLLEGRTACFESRLLGETSADLDKVGYIVIKVPETNPLFQSEASLDAMKKLNTQSPKIFTGKEIRLHASAAYGVPPEKITFEQFTQAAYEFMRKYGSISVVGKRDLGPGDESTAMTPTGRAKAIKSSAKRVGRPRALPIIGERVKDLRGDYSQPAFARRTKLSADVIQRAERGEATERTIRKLCKFARSNGSPLTAESFKKNTPPKAAET